MVFGKKNVKGTFKGRELHPSLLSIIKDKIHEIRNLALFFFFFFFLSVFRT